MTPTNTKYIPETFMVLDWIGYKMSAELACTYAALILNDDDVEITGDKITAILKVIFIRWILKIFWDQNLILILYV